MNSEMKMFMYKKTIIIFQVSCYVVLCELFFGFKLFLYRRFYCKDTTIFNVSHDLFK